MSALTSVTTIPTSIQNNEYIVPLSDITKLRILGELCNLIMEEGREIATASIPTQELNNLVHNCIWGQNPTPINSLLPLVVYQE